MSSSKSARVDKSMRRTSKRCQAIDYRKVATTALIECRKNFAQNQMKSNASKDQKSHKVKRTGMLSFRYLNAIYQLPRKEEQVGSTTL